MPSRPRRSHSHAPADDFIPCVPVSLPPELLAAATRTAIEHNPANAPPPEALAALAVAFTGAPDSQAAPYHLAVSRYWGAEKGVDLAVAFMEPCPADLRDRILSHANAWGTKKTPDGRTANIRFRWTQQLASAPVRLTRSGQGYWAYLGPDVLHVPVGEPTMCLQAFTMATPDREFYRVVRHEFGHICGFPHEQFLPEILSLLDYNKTIPWAMAYTGWSRQQVIQQMLTALPEGSYRMSAHADVNGIMEYFFPGSVTKNGQPIPGGTDIDDIDIAFAAQCYPTKVAPPPPTDGGEVTITVPRAGTYVLRSA